jgi:hypothetical protein
VRRRNLDINDVPAPVRHLIFEPEIGEAYVVVQHGEIVRLGPSGNLFPRAVGTSRAVRTIAISLLKKSLVLALQLVVEDDAPDAANYAVKRSIRSTRHRNWRVVSSRSRPVPE